MHGVASRAYTPAARPGVCHGCVRPVVRRGVRQFGEQQRNEVKLNITNVSDEPYVISKVAVPTDLFDITLPDRIMPGSTAEVTVKLTKLGAETEFEKSFTIEVNDTLSSRFTVPVKRKVRGTTSETGG